MIPFTIPAHQINQYVTIHPIIPIQANQGWKLELFELSYPVAQHYHKLQQHMIIMIKGTLRVTMDTITHVLKPGDLACINPGVVHSLHPEGTINCFNVGMPGFLYPDDVFDDIQSAFQTPWLPATRSVLPPMDPIYFKTKINHGTYVAYELITDRVASAALLEIYDSPKHYHALSKEIFIVVHGNLALEKDNQTTVLTPGQTVIINPGSVHHLKSADQFPVRVLCFNVPPFDPHDMHRI